MISRRRPFAVHSRKNTVRKPLYVFVTSRRLEPASPPDDQIHRRSTDRTCAWLGFGRR